jgi:hypothetical protein
VHADAQPIDQFTAEPFRPKSKRGARDRKGDSCTRGPRRASPTRGPTRGEETSHDEIPYSMQQTDLFSAGI